ncbi:hypothetical protein D8S78_12700 [Natrialba swarupiae]|nr:hypothetical protein [Natrialba swarupiae]
MLPDSFYGRLEWAVTESLIVSGILPFCVVAAGVSLSVGLLLFPLDLLGIYTPVRPTSRWSRESELGDDGYSDGSILVHR